MSDEHGTFEHADHTSPRKEHGYCTDDMARLLVVTSRETDPSAVAIELARKALRFVAGPRAYEAIVGTVATGMGGGAALTSLRIVGAEACGDLARPPPAAPMT